MTTKVAMCHRLSQMVGTSWAMAQVSRSAPTDMSVKVSCHSEVMN